MALGAKGFVVPKELLSVFKVFLSTLVVFV